MQLKFGRCICDDVQVEIAKKDFKSRGLCKLGHTHLERSVQMPQAEAVRRDRGKEVKLSLEEALEKAATMLVAAKKPLLYGWSHCTNETIREGLSLASTLKAVFDSNASMGLGQAMSSNLHEMKLDIDLEAVQNQGEFIIYWGSNPIESSHRHASRFTVFPRGDNIPQGVESRVIGVVDVRETETMKMANHRVIIPIGRDTELMRALISDLNGEPYANLSKLNLSSSALVGLTQALRKSDFTVIFYGNGILNSGKAKENLLSLAELITTLRGLGKKTYAMPMWHEPNDMGVVKSTGESAAAATSLDFSSRVPNSTNNPLTLQSLSKNEYDLALVVGSDALITLPGDAARGLAATKVIYIGPQSGLTEKRAVLSIRVVDDSVLGIGELTRSDMKDIQLKPWQNVKKTTASAFDVVNKLHQIIREKAKN
jgi:formylmethanofuran dehydrogenase subunit B